MASRTDPIHRPGGDDASTRVAGWPELHLALKSGIPHAMNIVAMLDAHGFSYPWTPEFNPQSAELRCYRAIHQAWRDRLLWHLLTVLAAWRAPEGELTAEARRPELHQALAEFLAAHRAIDPHELRICLASHSLAELVPENEPSTAADVCRRIEVAWKNRNH